MLDPKCSNSLDWFGKKETEDLLCALLLIQFKLQTLNILFPCFLLNLTLLVNKMNRITWDITYLSGKPWILLIIIWYKTRQVFLKKNCERNSLLLGSENVWKSSTKLLLFFKTKGLIWFTLIGFVMKKWSGQNFYNNDRNLMGNQVAALSFGCLMYKVRLD